MALTLVPSDLAKEGYRFTFQGANAGDECDGCPFTRLCFGLSSGRTYRVVKLRDVVHPCALHDPGKVRVAEVEETDFETTVETRLLRGTAVTWEPMECGYPECPTYALCHPAGQPAGHHHAIKETGDPVPCPMDFAITRVRLQRM